MKGRLKKIHAFFLIAASLFVAGFPAYFHYCNLVGADFRSADLSVENPDQDNLLVDHLNELKIVGSNGLSGVFLLESTLFEQLPLIAFQKPSLDAKAFTLRC